MSARPLQEPAHPPFNVVQPRQLVRWLDVNAQGGPLTRTRGFVQFNRANQLAIHWDGRSSDKYGQFNFQGARNFSLLSASILDLIPEPQRIYVGVFIANVVLANHLADLGVNNLPINDVVRYDLNPSALTEGVGAPVYTGQPMKGQYFQIEFWSAGIQGATQDVSLDTRILTTFLTSILGNLDYRYGADFPIHTVPPAFTFSYAQTNINNTDIFNLPLLFKPETINGVNT